MKLKDLCVILALLAFGVIGSVSVSAAAGTDLPELTDLPKSLTVYFSVQINGTDTPIPGAEIGINKIADLTSANGLCSYAVTEEYKALAKLEGSRDITFDGLSVSETVLLAGEFAAVTGEAEQTAVTDSNGKCSFQIAGQGMYLVRELSAEGEADKYELFEPYIISVPYPENYSGEWEWLYEVVSEPKTVITPKQEPSEPTGTSEPDGPTDPTEPDKTEKPSEPEEASSSVKPSSPDATSATDTPPSASAATDPAQPDNPVKTGEDVPAVPLLAGLLVFTCLAAIAPRIVSGKRNRDGT